MSFKLSLEDLFNYVSDNYKRFNFLYEHHFPSNYGEIFRIWIENRVYDIGYNESYEDFDYEDFDGMIERNYYCIDITNEDNKIDTEAYNLLKIIEKNLKDD